MIFPNQLRQRVQPERMYSSWHYRPIQPSTYMLHVCTPWLNNLFFFFCPSCAPEAVSAPDSSLLTNWLLCHKRQGGWAGGLAVGPEVGKNIACMMRASGGGGGGGGFCGRRVLTLEGEGGVEHKGNSLHQSGLLGNQAHFTLASAP